MFAKIEQLGGISVRKVKAHVTRLAVVEGLADPTDKARNYFADQQAKLGAVCHPRDATAKSRCTQSAKVVTL
eukprot:9050588-Heterocapsa_arctica.AAC.1